MEAPQKKRIDFFEQQYDAFNFETQFAAVIAGVQSGKTFLGSHFAGKKIKEFPKGNGLICAPTYKILQQSTLDKFFQEYPVLRRFYKEQKGIIELPTGGRVFIRSADQPLGIEGMTINWAWGDELGMSPRLIWIVIRSRVSLTGGQVLITTTPYNMGWLYQDFYLPWKEGTAKDLSVFTWRSIDNPYFPKEFYDREKARLRPEEFARRYMGEFKKMEGLVYDLPLEQIIEPIEGLVRKAKFIGAGIDWGYRVPAAISVCAYWDGAWYVVREWYETEKTTQEIIQAAKDLKKELRIEKFFPDPAEPDRIRECKDAGLNLGESNKDLKAGVSHLQDLIKNKRFYVFRTCRNFLDEAENYHYPEGQEGKAFKDEPVAINNHLLDSARYLIHSYDPTGDVFMKTKQSDSGKKLQYYPELGF